jgi:hypothetical protein
MGKVKRARYYTQYTNKKSQLVEKLPLLLDDLALRTYVFPY